MPNGRTSPGRWATAGKGLLLLWLALALIRPHPGILRRGLTDLQTGLRPHPLPRGATDRPELLEVLDSLDSLDRDQRWRALLVLPLPAQLQADSGRFDEWSGAGLGDLAHQILQVAYQGFPRRVDVAFLSSDGRLLRVSFRPTERFVPKVPVRLADYEIVAVARETGLTPDRMMAISRTSSGAIVLYGRTNAS